MFSQKHLQSMLPTMLKTFHRLTKANSYANDFGMLAEKTDGDQNLMDVSTVNTPQKIQTSPKTLSTWKNIDLVEE